MILAPEDCGCELSDGSMAMSNCHLYNGTYLFMLLLEGYLKGRCEIATPCQRVDSVLEVEPEYDFIVVGGGTAGSMVAGRISENPNFDVLLLEAGGQEPISARAPSLYRALWFQEQYDWSYRTVPSDDYCLDQEGIGCQWPRGKVLGGTSVINGMMYHRGREADYDEWAKAGAEGWSWDENLPYFYMTEGNKEIGSLVNEKYHSADGPLPIQRFKNQPPFIDELLLAVEEAELPIMIEMADPETPEGFCVAQMASDNGQRYTTARAYLKPKSERPNLSVKLHAHVTKVLFDEDCGKLRAVGVEYYDENGDLRTVRASKEVILSAGALNTPQILLLSGIGPRDTLEKFNIPLIAELPVGYNLRNHIGITLEFILTKVDNTRVLDWSVLTDYLLMRDGPMTSTGLTQFSGTLYSSLADRERNQTDLQFFFNGFYAEASKTGVIGEAVDYPNNGTNITIDAVSLQPRSVGYITLNSSDPLDPPLFYPEYFSHPDDMIMVKDGARYIQRIFETDIFQNKYGIMLDADSTERCSDSGEEWSDEWLECMVRLHTDPQNHQLGTAAIGTVIDSQLRVYHVKGLRVIDASSIPRLPSGNPQGPIMMVAERGADFIKQTYQDT